jgi:hypothetical protein
MYYVYKDADGELHFFVEQLSEDAAVEVWFDYIGIATLSLAAPSEPEPV